MRVKIFVCVCLSSVNLWWGVYSFLLPVIYWIVYVSIAILILLYHNLCTHPPIDTIFLCSLQYFAKKQFGKECFCALLLLHTCSILFSLHIWKWKFWVWSMNILNFIWNWQIAFKGWSNNLRSHHEVKSFHFSTCSTIYNTAQCF